MSVTLTSRGVAVTAWTSYTPTLNNSSNVSANEAFYRRVGDTIEVRGYLAYSGAGTGASLAISLPSGLEMDTAKMSSASNELTSLGIFNYLDAGTNYRTGNVTYATTTTVGLVADSAGGAYANTQFANNDKISYNISAPIVGWGVS